MADEKLSAKTSTTTTTGSYLYIIIPDGSGGWLPRKITHANLLAALQSTVDANSAHIAKAEQKNRQASKNADFTVSLGSNVSLEGIDFIWISGTVNVKVGTSLGASDVLPLQTLTSGSLRNLVQKYYSGATTLYFTLTGGGTIDAIINYKPNYNS